MHLALFLALFLSPGNVGLHAHKLLTCLTREASLEVAPIPTCGWCYLFTVSNSSLLFVHVAGSGLPSSTFSLPAEKETFSHFPLVTMNFLIYDIMTYVGSRRCAMAKVIMSDSYRVNTHLQQTNWPRREVNNNPLMLCTVRYCTCNGCRWTTAHELRSIRLAPIAIKQSGEYQPFDRSLPSIRVFTRRVWCEPCTP